MNNKRLLKLADLLDAHHDNGVKFDLGCWRTPEDPECGTAACAVGLAMQNKWFNEQGLYGYVIPNYRDVFGWEAVVSFFALGRSDHAEYLFQVDSYDVTTGDAAARLVAERIRNVVANGFPATL